MTQMFLLVIRAARILKWNFGTELDCAVQKAIFFPDRISLISVSKWNCRRPIALRCFTLLEMTSLADRGGY